MGETGADAVDHLADYPNVRQALPAFAQLTEDTLFDLGVEIILDGTEHRRTD